MPQPHARNPRISDLTHLSAVHRVVRRSAFCTYCGVEFSAAVPFEEEHVIGRRFVPKGTLAGNWNLVLRACGSCNDIKAALENDISAITMQPDASGRYACDDPRLIAEARRKARTTSNLTGRFVSEPESPLLFKSALGPATFEFSFLRPAQADNQRLFDLARFQLAGFFSLLTWQADQQRGWYWLGKYCPLVVVRKEDWGNPHLLWIENLARDWEPRLHAITAEGFYKIWIRRCPQELPVWAWAIEWNRNFRLAGLFGEVDGMRQHVATLPPLPIQDMGPSLAGSNGETRIRMRYEVPLTDEQDTLFC